MFLYKGRDLALDVREAGASLKLVFMNCDASFPSDLDQASFHPLIIYIQIPRRKVGLSQLLGEECVCVCVCVCVCYVHTNCAGAGVGEVTEGELTA